MSGAPPLPGRVVIIGAGLAGVQAAMELRTLGGDGEVVLIGEEARAYDRPPLSKDLLIDQAEPAGFDLLSDDIARAQDITFQRGMRVQAIDRASKRLALSDGSSYAYDKLILATGGAAAELPALPSDRRRVFVLRHVEDATALSQAMKTARRLLVVGAGWLGLEAALAGRARGLDVTLIEQGGRVCARSVPEAVSDHLLTLQRDQGVDVRLGSAWRVVAGDDGVQLSPPEGGSEELFDLCVVAVGMRPRDELARAAGLACDNGIVADAQGRTEDPDIYAIGDVAAWWNPTLGRRLRLESWQGARLQARVVAASMLGLEGPVEAPWFWSTQTNQLLQAAGCYSPDAVLIDAESGDKPLWRYGVDGRPSFIIGVNRARDLRMAHREMAASWRPQPETQS